MTDQDLPLEEIRRQIDEIDDFIHGQLMRRGEIARLVASAKRKQLGLGPNDAVFGIRPDREADILRRLEQAHDSPLPFPAIAQMWMELINAMTSLQGPLRVAVGGGDDPFHLWDLARRQYGSNTEIIRCETATDVIVRADSGALGTIGVLPMPYGEQEEKPWWPHLLSSWDKGLRVIGKLPFWRATWEDKNHAPVQALMVTRHNNQPTGFDESMMVIRTEGVISRSGLVDRLARKGMSARWLDSREVGRDYDHLIIVDGFIPLDDPKLYELVEEDGLSAPFVSIHVLGSYAKPLYEASVHPSY